MWTLLFDIDGTLLRTQGAGLKAIRSVMQEMFGVQELPKVRVHGRTDFGIMEEFFAFHQIEFESNVREFLDRYSNRLESTLSETPGFLLPGVVELLGVLHQNNDFSIGLLTGNCQKAAEIKIKHFGISEFFPSFGGFGDRTGDRNEVASLARDSARTFLGGQFDSRKIWVIGDTVNDVVCGRSIGAHVMAVETGGCSRAELEQAGPDKCFKDLKDLDSVVSGFYASSARD